jgi:hypothetical protein
MRDHSKFEIRHTCTQECVHPWKSLLWSRDPWLVTFPEGQRYISNGYSTATSDCAGFATFEEARAYTVYRINAVAVPQ